MRLDPTHSLEGLCGLDEEPAEILHSTARPHLVRMYASLRGQAFAPHRHDSYALGVTLSGVQTFKYRGSQRHCLPGDLHILHPDELHDGASGTDSGFSYHIAYIDPVVVQQTLAIGSLPFVADPVVRLGSISDNLRALWTLTEQSEAQEVEAIEVATALLQAVAGGARNIQRMPTEQLARARDLIASDPRQPVSSEALEKVSGLDRWTVARGFRRLYGTSPSRFRTMRQVDLAKSALRSGKSLVEAALLAGFADQSHMTRQFKRAVGMSPGAWSTLSRRGQISCTH